LVIALGGNAILQPGQRGSASEQFTNIGATCKGLASIVETGFHIAITHGNGPQIGNRLIQNHATEAVPAMPMDICGAETQGMIGYMFQQTLASELERRGMHRKVVSIVTQVVVDPDDRGFLNPTKPVGPFYGVAHAQEKQAAGETWVEDAGRGWRRVVPSPDPKRIVEIEVIETLVQDGTIVICTGGGGIPVVVTQAGTLKGVEAVIDKDLAGERLATSLGADMFMVLTDVPGAAVRYGKPGETWLRNVTVEEARRLQAAGHFRSGSMGPKVEACCRFAEARGRPAVIASMERAIEALRGEAGTRITP